MSDLEGHFSGRGLRLTWQRRVVLAVVEAATDHPCANEIYLRATRHRAIGIATVYRTLSQLVAMGLITRYSLADGTPRYARAGCLPAAHLVDAKTGTLVALEDEGLGRLLKSEAKKLGYRLVKYRLKVVGVASSKLGAFFSARPMMEAPWIAEACCII